MKSYRKSIPIGKTQIIPALSRVLPSEKQCCDCAFFIENIDSKNPLGYCKWRVEPTLKYDECGAFSPILLENSK